LLPGLFSWEFVVMARSKTNGSQPKLMKAADIPTDKLQEFLAVLGVSEGTELIHRLVIDMDWRGAGLVAVRIERYCENSDQVKV
jgi:hypothetical protein